MSKLTDIIEAAAQAWEAYELDGLHTDGGEEEGLWYCNGDIERFWAFFDPEHLALMEAVIAAVRRRDDLPVPDIRDDEALESATVAYVAADDAIEDALAALETYREGRGLL